MANYKNDYNSVSFKANWLKFGQMLAESHH